MVALTPRRWLEAADQAMSRPPDAMPASIMASCRRCGNGMLSHRPEPRRRGQTAEDQRAFAADDDQPKRAGKAVQRPSESAARQLQAVFARLTGVPKPPTYIELYRSSGQTPWVKQR